MLQPGAFIRWSAVTSYGWAWQEGAMLVIDAGNAGTVGDGNLSAAGAL